MMTRTQEQRTRLYLEVISRHPTATNPSSINGRQYGWNVDKCVEGNAVIVDIVGSTETGDLALETDTTERHDTACGYTVQG